MKSDAVTVERFYTEHSSALELNLVAGASGLKRIIREPTVNRPGLALSGFTRYFRQQAAAGDRQCRSVLPEVTVR